MKFGPSIILICITYLVNVNSVHLDLSYLSNNPRINVFTSVFKSLEYIESIPIRSFNITNIIVSNDIVFTNPQDERIIKVYSFHRQRSDPVFVIRSMFLNVPDDPNRSEVQENQKMELILFKTVRVTLNTNNTSHDSISFVDEFSMPELHSGNIAYRVFRGKQMVDGMYIVNPNGSSESDDSDPFSDSERRLFYPRPPDGGSRPGGGRGEDGSDDDDDRRPGDSGSGAVTTFTTIPTVRDIYTHQTQQGDTEVNKTPSEQKLYPEDVLKLERIKTKCQVAAYTKNYYEYLKELKRKKKLLKNKKYEDKTTQTDESRLDNSYESRKNECSSQQHEKGTQTDNVDEGGMVQHAGREDESQSNKLETSEEEIDVLNCSDFDNEDDISSDEMECDRKPLKSIIVECGDDRDDESFIMDDEPESTESNVPTGGNVDTGMVQSGPKNTSPTSKEVLSYAYLRFESGKSSQRIPAQPSIERNLTRENQPQVNDETDSEITNSGQPTPYRESGPKYTSSSYKMTLSSYKNYQHGRSGSNIPTVKPADVIPKSNEDQTKNLRNVRHLIQPTISEPQRVRAPVPIRPGGTVPSTQEQQTGPSDVMQHISTETETGDDEQE